jgi:hypothetical protein
MPDLDEAEQTITAYRAAPFENIPGGPVLVRIVRQVRALTTTVANLKARIEDLEARLPPPP